VLIAVYALFALAASARAGVQIATKFGNARSPTCCRLRRRGVHPGYGHPRVGSPTARRIAVLSCSVELAGVLAVGTWSLADPATFPTPQCGRATARLRLRPARPSRFRPALATPLDRRARTRRTIVTSAKMQASDRRRRRPLARGGPAQGVAAAIRAARPGIRPERYGSGDASEAVAGSSRA